MTRFHSPWLSDSACYSRIFRLSFLPPGRDSGTKRHSGSVFSSRRNSYTFKISTAEAVCYLVPCDSVVEGTFPVFCDLLTIVNRSLPGQASALLMRRPGGLTETEWFPLKETFLFPHHLSNLLSLT